ncbi:hypothetical protein L484_016196 [Morus notabilis]|uniref:Uncharacterized protein n=1 Tax=Morus notabilis TaxID=981085 RepID=W9S7J6_9ROSA|nr:hypothetical protein L484_016196 [Morus notabilis]
MAQKDSLLVGVQIFPFQLSPASFHILSYAYSVSTIEGFHLTLNDIFAVYDLVEVQSIFYHFRPRSNWQLFSNFDFSEPVNWDLDHVGPSASCPEVSKPLAFPAPPPINLGGHNPPFSSRDLIRNFHKPDGSWIHNTDYCLNPDVGMTINFNLDTNKDIQRQNQYSLSEFEELYVSKTDEVTLLRAEVVSYLKKELRIAYGSEGNWTYSEISSRYEEWKRNGLVKSATIKVRQRFQIGWNRALTDPSRRSVQSPQQCFEALGLSYEKYNADTANEEDFIEFSSDSEGPDSDSTSASSFSSETYSG